MNNHTETLCECSSAQVRRHLEQGGRLIDIRSRDEFEREHIAGAENICAEELSQHSFAGQNVVFSCLSGKRTAMNAATLRACVGQTPQVLQGGLTAWKADGLPTVKAGKTTVPLMRQVQIVAGSLVLVGVLLGVLLSPWFLWLAGLVGAGLVFAGVSGFCGMAVLLAKMPWNRV